MEVVTFACLALLHIRGNIGQWRSLRTLLVPMSLVLVTAAVSTAFSEELSRSVPQLVRWFWLAAVLILVLHAVQRGLTAVVVGLLLIAVSAQIFWGQVLWFLQGSASALQSGTFYAPNQYAGFILLVTPVLICLAVRSAGTGLIVAIGLSAIALSSIFLSGSRGALIAVSVAIVLTGIGFHRSGVPRWTRLGVVSLVAVAVTFVALSVVGSDVVGAEKAKGRTSKFDENPRSLLMRWRWAEGAIRIGAAKPLTGSGLGTFGNEFFRIQEPDWDWSLFAHNDYLELLAEGGLVMMVGMLVFVGRSIRHGMKDWPRPDSEALVFKIGCWAGVAGSSLHMFVDHDWSYPALAAAFVMMCGICMPLQAQDDLQRVDRSSGSKARIISLATLLILVAASHPVAGLLTPREVGSASVWVAPYSYELRLKLASSRASEGRIAEAEKALRAAIVLDRLEPRARWMLGSLLAERGRVSDASRIFREVIAIAPNAADSYLRAARFEASQGRTDAALRVLATGISRLRVGGPERVAPLVELRDEITQEESGP